MRIRRALLVSSFPFAAALAVACGDEPGGDPGVCREGRAAAWGPRTQCGPTLDLTPINQYQGALASAQDREGAVVLIAGSCTGTLIAASAGPVVLTAGHCSVVGGTVQVAFNVEANPDGEALVTEGTVLEQATSPDYALITLAQVPASISPTALTRLPSDTLAIIQHPRGGPKVIGEGAFEASCDELVYYAELDTLVGSSGAGVLNQQGYLVGIHTDGDCTTDGRGLNRGWTAESIVAASTYLVDADLADR
ncbi:MAG: serine protease [Kofleriaceae bacterium]